jgi:hypothetical protein
MADKCRITFTNEVGGWIYAVVAVGCPEDFLNRHPNMPKFHPYYDDNYWLDAFNTRKQALDFIKKEGLECVD